MEGFILGSFVITAIAAVFVLYVYFTTKNRLNLNIRQTLNMKQYRIGKTPNLTAQRNIKTWAYIKTELEKCTVVDYDSLIALCINHDHPGGGKGFVDYCIKYGWLSEVKN